MAENDLTLSTLLGLDQGTPEERRLSEEAVERFAEHLRGEAAALAPGWRDAVAERIGETLRAACDVPVANVLAATWNQYRELLEYRDPEKHPTGEFSLVPLRKHTIDSTHHPFVELYVGETRLGALEFEVKVEITLEGALLGIKNGRFRELRTGTSEVKATVSWEGATLLERPLEKYTLPGVIGFGEGIPIAPSIPVLSGRA